MHTNRQNSSRRILAGLVPHPIIVGIVYTPIIVMSLWSINLAQSTNSGKPIRSAEPTIGPVVVLRNIDRDLSRLLQTEHVEAANQFLRSQLREHAGNFEIANELLDRLVRLEMREQKVVMAISDIETQLVQMRHNWDKGKRMTWLVRHVQKLVDSDEFACAQLYLEASIAHEEDPEVAADLSFTWGDIEARKDNGADLTVYYVELESCFPHLRGKGLLRAAATASREARDGTANRLYMHVACGDYDNVNREVARHALKVKGISLNECSVESLADIQGSLIGEDHDA